MAALLAGLLIAGALPHAAAYDSKSRGSVAAAEELVGRVLPGSQQHFVFRLVPRCDGLEKGKACYQLADSGNQLVVSATGVSELTAGLGYYLRHYCNMTIGWKRGGGSRIAVPSAWPQIGEAGFVRSRSVPWSYMMNVCTHSYSLVWYDWQDWQRFIDWMALSGINNVLALTGQEEVQFKVFQKLGLKDDDIRGWFNGPAFLTWSRGQNEYGAGIAGPLPRSWMKEQWELQKQILARYRALGIVGQLPGFQGNVPASLKAIAQDSNMTIQGATGWIDALDPLFQKVADVWMETMIEDFGTDHWYQLDGYFNGGTAPWLLQAQEASSAPSRQLQESKTSEAVAPDPAWYARGQAAFRSLNKTDPEAIWSFQGFAFEFWKEQKQASWLKGFVAAVPAGRFSIVDMDYGFGQWQKFADWWGDEKAFFGANFIWSKLHNFGGTDGIKGNLSMVKDMPFAAQEANANVWGTGFTGEGIDQNPAYYDLLIDQPWRTERMPNISQALIDRAQRRYGVAQEVPEVSAAWTLLGESMYAQDVGVQDSTGVGHLPGGATWDFLKDGVTPTDSFCKTYQAWSHLTAAASHVTDTKAEPFSYDLVNLGRDVLARLSTPMSIRLSKSIFAAGAPNVTEVNRAGATYIELLHDLDTLLGTDEAFLLGNWLAMARRFGENTTDCNVPDYPQVKSCPDFYEWNARAQLTTWNPTPADAKAVPRGPIDYATKHWHGLVGSYDRERALRLVILATHAAMTKTHVTPAMADQVKATWAHDWQTDFSLKFAEKPAGDAVAISKKLLAKYAPHFSSCAAKREDASIYI
eukprot:TRINITY_DN10875_c0_g1_i1.p1 TRINITY_DN10875_c0_g1~~TRINITY_DN10875_c0_g1_i1.p1  ORF type:complete len:829 (-),score=178.72 TRINITY_DN10875_c0_g1_i1:88-2508(-)